ncbi:maltose phosphorylase [Thermoflavifilum aggregans]|uniref:Maltose phosphorylase n=1 Tax=Thermoflavifilum aggregans TaxID=454188 RepID=A0A2M9CVP3_9BACT|nr:family 65 glycosyl hydrolase domain-containing protein [Thermoflavifilum aggregans]PJJ75964.1 maltose phosphorylase [Thermoflavifilum aggregans]
MKSFVKADPWKIIQDGFDPAQQLVAESLFSIGNGRMGQRGNFEEKYSGPSLQGHYVGGVYYPDRTKVGWWKNGYPEYFAKVLNAPSWIQILWSVDGEEVDLYSAKAVPFFYRELNMHDGYLKRSCIVELKNGKQLQIDSLRFCSMTRHEAGVIQYAITPLNFSGNIQLCLPVDAHVQNADANYKEKFWEHVHSETSASSAFVVARTKKSGFVVSTGIHARILLHKQILPVSFEYVSDEKYAALQAVLPVEQGNTYVIEKYAAVLSSLNHQPSCILTSTQKQLQTFVQLGFDQLLAEQKNYWSEKWQTMDVQIDGDVHAQQGIRFNIFQLHQTYTGDDERLNIGPKGFTGEKYGGATYWDTEAYCLPFYLATAGQQVARNLLLYRYRHLPKAIENARKLGFSKGAALYPMVTMNGEECHNEWEITFEEIHRNGAIAYAIWNYVNYTGDEAYLIDYGLEVLIAIARFWAQRVNWSEPKQKYVILGVTGPNEYENNVNNNWYTNYIACWCMEYAETVIQYVKQQAPQKFAALCAQLEFDEENEISAWKHIRQHIYLPEEPSLGILLQQEGYLDKEQQLVSDLSPDDLPLYKHWSWDRILRSCFIKQADVLQGIYFFEDRFSIEQIRRNFYFYEPRTVHESSLSPCIHSILAAKIGDEQKAYELYLRTARLDLDDYNKDTADGCHITSMAGTWLSIVQGFAGMRVRRGALHFRPFIPRRWQAYEFRFQFRGNWLRVRVSQKEILLENHGNKPLEVFIFDEPHRIDEQLRVCVQRT